MSDIGTAAVGARHRQWQAEDHLLGPASASGCGCSSAHSFKLNNTHDHPMSHRHDDAITEAAGSQHPLSGAAMAPLSQQGGGPSGGMPEGDPDTCQSPVSFLSTPSSPIMMKPEAKASAPVKSAQSAAQLHPGSPMASEERIARLHNRLSASARFPHAASSSCIPLQPSDALTASSEAGPSGSAFDSGLWNSLRGTRATGSLRGRSGGQQQQALQAGDGAAPSPSALRPHHGRSSSFSRPSARSATRLSLSLAWSRQPSDAAASGTAEGDPHSASLTVGGSLSVRGAEVQADDDGSRSLEPASDSEGPSVGSWSFKSLRSIPLGLGSSSEHIALIGSVSQENRKFRFFGSAAGQQLDRESDSQEGSRGRRGRERARAAARQRYSSEPRGPGKGEGAGEGSDWQVVGRRDFAALQDKYEVERVMGRGQSGVVSQCRHKESGRLFACKSVKKEPYAAEGRLEDLKREVGFLTLFQQSNVVAVQAVFEDARAVHIVMELCTGGDLAEYLAARGRCSEREAARLLLSVLLVVQRCHAMSLCHRDLKLSNFMLAHAGEGAEVKAIDFGSATFCREGEVLTEMAGSPSYMAPEVVAERYGLPCDIWSAGVMLHKLLAGRPPFEDRSALRLFEKIAREEVDLQAEPWPEVSEGAKELVRRMLQKDPAQRPTAAELLSDPWLTQSMPVDSD